MFILWWWWWGGLVINLLSNKTQETQDVCLSCVVELGQKRRKQSLMYQQTQFFFISAKKYILHILHIV